MSGYVSEGALPDDDEGHRASVLYIVAASLLSGLGLFLTLLWLITFQWGYLSGVLLMALGFLLFFSRRAGADRAE